MRLACNPQMRLDCPPIERVSLNGKCRDEIVPILRALQHIYSDKERRQDILALVGKDVNRTSSRRHGRPGLDYWQIVVLAAVRLGCNLDYDKLQDLAEQHRNLRLMMGIGDWEEAVDFDWRRIRENLSFLRPETLQKINQLVVGAGHELAPKAVQAVRGDTFVMETNVHYPTESSLIGDGLRKVITLAGELAAEHDVLGWRQQEHLLKKAKKLVHRIGRASRAKGKAGSEQVRAGYERLLPWAENLLERARDLVQTLAQAEFICVLAGGASTQELTHYVELTEKICRTARRRVFDGEVVPNSAKIFSVFEPHTELIKRGKQPNPIQFGHNVLVIEDSAGFVCDYEVVANGVLDQDLVIPVMTRLQRRMGGKIKRASFDRAFHTPENQEKLAEIILHPCIPMKGDDQSRQQKEEATVAFRKGRKKHPGIESAINALQGGNGMKRCRDKSKRGYERYAGLAILGRNLQTLGKLLLAQDEADCQAAQSKRKLESED